MPTPFIGSSGQTIGVTSAPGPGSYSDILNILRPRNLATTYPWGADLGTYLSTLNLASGRDLQERQQAENTRQFDILNALRERQFGAEQGNTQAERDYRRQQSEQNLAQERAAMAEKQREFNENLNFEREKTGYELPFQLAKSAGWKYNPEGGYFTDSRGYLGNIAKLMGGGYGNQVLTPGGYYWATPQLPHAIGASPQNTVFAAA